MSFNRTFVVLALACSFAIAAFTVPASAEADAYADVAFETVVTDPKDSAGFFDIRNVSIGELPEETAVFRVQTEPFQAPPSDARLALNFTTSIGNFSTGITGDGVIWAGDHSAAGFDDCRTVPDEGLVYCEMSYMKLGTYPPIAEGYAINNTTAWTDLSDPADETAVRQDSAPAVGSAGPEMESSGSGEPSEGDGVGEVYHLRDPLAPADIKLSSDVEVVEAVQGEPVEVPLSLENFGEQETSIEWSIDSHRDLELEIWPTYGVVRAWQHDDHARQMALETQVPDDLAPGEYDVTVQAVGDETEDVVTASIRVEARERTAPLTLEIDRTSRTAEPGVWITEDLQLRNERDVPVRYDLSVEAVDGAGSAWVEPVRGLLQPGETVSGEVSLSAPDDPDADSYEFVLRAGSDAGEPVVEQLELHVAPPAEGAPSSLGASGGETPTVPAPSAALALVAIAAAGVVLRRRR